MVSIVTTPTGSFTNSVGAAIAKVIGEHTKIHAIVQAQALAAMPPVSAGNADFGLANSYDISFFATGTGDYEGQPKHANLRQVAAVTTYRVALHVRADSPIKTIAELKGKRVSSGFNAQKTIGRTITALLANGGLTYKDVQGVLAPNVSRSAEAMARLQKFMPGAYSMTINPAPNIDGITTPTKVVAFDAVFFTRADVPDDVVYAVTKALHDNKKDLVATFRPMSLFDPDHMAKNIQEVPFHPGALKYYKEIGIAPK